MANNESDKSDIRIIIIGAGMAGILSGIRLREAGYDNWVIYEKTDEDATMRGLTSSHAGTESAGVTTNVSFSFFPN